MADSSRKLEVQLLLSEVEARYLLLLLQNYLGNASGPEMPRDRETREEIFTELKRALT